MPIEVYPIVQREFWLPFAVLFFALVSHLVPQKSRRAVLILVFIMVGLVAQQTSWHLTKPPIYSLRGVIVDGVCRQSSYDTCGAAASVTMLKAMGIEATEGEMAKLSMSEPGKGVSPHLAALGLQRKINQSGRSATVRLKVPDINSLRDLRQPFLAGIKFSATTNHMVCVLAVTPDHLIVGDPISVGKLQWSWTEFKEKWSGIIIIAA